MILTALLDRYFAARDISDGYRRQLRSAVRQFSQWLGRIPDVGHLTADKINAHLVAMRTAGAGPTTRANRRILLLLLWQFANELGEAPRPQRSLVMRIRRCPRLVRAWSADDVGRLLEAADRLTGRHAGTKVSRRMYWRSYVLAAWDTGLRRVDLLSLERDWIPPHGQLTIIQHKTRRTHHVCLRPKTLDAIEESFPPDRRLIWPRWASMETWRREGVQLVRTAGLPGSIGLLRHSSGTAVERAHPGQGHLHLGNGRQVFEQHYLDWSQVEADRPMPPALCGD